MANSNEQVILKIPYLNPRTENDKTMIYGLNKGAEIINEINVLKLILLSIDLTMGITVHEHTGIKDAYKKAVKGFLG